MAKHMEPMGIYSGESIKGPDALSMNIAAAREVAEAIQSTLGPKGMDKMLVNGMGDVIISNDGATILKEMAIEHPSAKMMVEVAQTQDEEIGDGTTTAVVLAGELLERAQDLVNSKIHPTQVVRGYRKAMIEACRVLREIAEPVSVADDRKLAQLAITSMAGKLTDTGRKKIANLAVESVKLTMQSKDDPGESKIVSAVGEGLENSFLVAGAVLDKEPTNAGMPQRIASAKIALVANDIDAKKVADAEIEIRSPQHLQGFLASEEAQVRQKVEQLRGFGVNAVFCQKKIGDLAAAQMARLGILGVSNVSEDDMTFLSRATGAKTTAIVQSLTSGELGSAGAIEVRKLGTSKYIIVKDCPATSCATIVLRGGTKQVVDQAEKAVNDAIGNLSAALESGAVLGGAGAPEIEVARRLRAFANTLSGREQLAVSAFAEALEVIPRTIAENAGLDSMGILVSLRASHDRGKKWAGVDVNAPSGEVTEDTLQEGILEALSLKTQAFISAVEAACMILRIDDVLAKTTSAE